MTTRDMTPHQYKTLQCREAMLRCGGNMTAAAATLGVSRWTVWRTLKDDEERVEREMEGGT